MTDHPTKGPFSNAQWTMIFDYMVRVDRLTDRAEFSRPNREANASKFMLVDELVSALEAAENAMACPREKGSACYCPNCDRSKYNALHAVRDILAKIKGETP